MAGKLQKLAQDLINGMTAEQKQKLLQKCEAIQNGQDLCDHCGEIIGDTTNAVASSKKENVKYCCQQHAQVAGEDV